MFISNKIKQNILGKIYCKNFSIFFYKFGNDESESNLNMNKTLNPNTISGLKFAYKNFIESVYDKDFEYIQKNCEKTFGEKVSKSINEEKLFISESDTSINLSLTNIEFHIGAESNRYNNKLYDITKMDSIFYSKIKSVLGLPDIDDEKFINFYTPKKLKFPPSLYSIARLEVQFHSNLILSDSLINKQNFEYHNVIFEIGNIKPINLYSILNPNILKDLGFPNFDEDLILDIVISDFDDVLEGNPLI